MKSSPIVIFVLALVGAYLAGFGAIRAGCGKSTGPIATGPGILIGPDWYGGEGLGGLLSEIYWPMFWFEQKVTGEEMCFVLTKW
jgi:hypothetical protein